ncbi:hypothetical protein [Oceanithermus sp.]
MGEHESLNVLDNLVLFRTMLVHAEEKAVKDRDFEEAEAILDQARETIEVLKPEIAPELYDELIREWVGATLKVQHIQSDYPPNEFDER